MAAPTSYNAALTASASTNTKGAYVQLTASTPYDSSLLYINPGFSNGSSRFLLVDIATGGAGSETVVVSNICLRSDTDWIIGGWAAISVDIPAGTRVSMRCQSGTGSATIGITVMLCDRALGSLSAPVTYGASTGSSVGTAVDPGGTANTKGAYVQVTASSSARIDRLLVTCTLFTAISGTLGWTIDIATGGAGSETIVVPDLLVGGGNSADQVTPPLLSFLVSIAASTRIAARCACSVNTVSQRIPYISLIGMQEPATGGGSAAGAVAYVG
jgi:hypothetical protein